MYMTPPNKLQHSNPEVVPEAISQQAEGYYVQRIEEQQGNQDCITLAAISDMQLQREVSQSEAILIPLEQHSPVTQQLQAWIGVVSIAQRQQSKARVEEEEVVTNPEHSLFQEHSPVEHQEIAPQVP